MTDPARSAVAGAPVFISYSHSNPSLPEALHRELGPDVAFFDSPDIEHGENFVDTLLEALLAAKVVVAFVDPNYLKSHYCQLELRVALWAYHTVRERGLSPDAKQAALDHVVIALPSSFSPELRQRLPRPLRTTHWPGAHQTTELASLIRRRLETSSTLGEELGELYDLDALRSQLEALDLLAPQSLVGRRTYFRPGGTRPSLKERFLGRAEELERVHEALTPGGDPTGGHTVVVVGCDGLGKSTLAAEYVHRHGREYPGGVFWVDAGVPSEEDVGEQLHGILSTLATVPPWMDFPEGRKGDVAAELRAALEKRATDEPILYVVDNLPEPAPGDPERSVKAWCPAPAAVSLLVTTRMRRSFNGGKRIDLGVLTTRDARAVLTHGYASPTVLTSEEWDRITSWVGRLPLALEMLNQQLVRGALEPQLLLQHAEASRPVETLDAAARHETTTLTGVSEAFSIPYRRLAPEAQGAARLVAQLSGDAIPCHLVEALGPTVSSAAETLLERSFVAPVPDEREVMWYGRMHPVVGDFLLAQADDAEAELRRTCQGVKGVLERTDSRDPELWALLNGCRSHAQHLYRRARSSGGDETRSEAVALGLSIGALLRSQGRLFSAEATVHDVLGVADELWSEDVVRTLPARDALAAILRAQGRLSDAQRLQDELLRAGEGVLPPDHPDLLAYKAQLAGTLATQGERREARRLYEEVVEASERALGKETADSLSYKQGLANVLAADGQLDEACRIQAGVAEAASRVPTIAGSVILGVKSALAGILAQMGRLEDAERLQEEVVAGGHVLPDDHPDRLSHKADLAWICAARGRRDQARRLREEIVDRADAGEGADGPHTARVIARVRAELGVSFGEDGDLDHARRAFEEALAASRRPGFPPGDRARYAWNLFAVLRRMKQFESAERLRAEELDWLVGASPDQLDDGQQDVQAILAEHLARA